MNDTYGGARPPSSCARAGEAFDQATELDHQPAMHLLRTDVERIANAIGWSADRLGVVAAIVTASALRAAFLSAYPARRRISGRERVRAPYSLP